MTNQKMTQKEVVTKMSKTAQAVAKVHPPVNPTERMNQVQAIVDGKPFSFNVARGLGELEQNAEKISAHLGEWLLIYNGRVVIPKTGYSAGKPQLIADVYSERETEFSTWLSPYTEPYVRQNELPCVIKAIRPGQPIVLSGDEVPEKVAELFTAWIEKNASRIGAIKSQVGADDPDEQVNY